MKKIGWVLSLFSIVFVFTACREGTEKKAPSKETDVSVVKESETSESITEGFVFSDINKDSESKLIYDSFIDTAKKDITTYGDKENPYQSILVILYKPQCPDCKEVEGFVSSKVIQAKKSAELIAKSEDFKYTVVAVDIEKDVPNWVGNIYGLSDETDSYSVPKFAVLTLKKDSSNRLVWDMYNQYTGTNKDSIVPVIDFYINDDYASYLDTVPTDDVKYLVSETV